MKKLFTLTFMMIMGCVMTFAQSVEFVDKDGKTVASGSVFNANGETEDMGWAFEMGSGLYVKNNAGSNANVELILDVKSCTEDTSLSCCAGGQCTPLFDGENTKTFSVAGNATEDPQIHWTYEDAEVEAGAEIVLTLKQDGKVASTVTLKFSNIDTGIDSVIAGDSKCNVYDITGKLVKANVSKNAVYGMNKGLYIVRELAGAKNVNKVIVK